MGRRPAWHTARRRSRGVECRVYSPAPACAQWGSSWCGLRCCRGGEEPPDSTDVRRSLGKFGRSIDEQNLCRMTFQIEHVPDEIARRERASVRERCRRRCVGPPGAVPRLFRGCQSAFPRRVSTAKAWQPARWTPQGSLRSGTPCPRESVAPLGAAAHVQRLSLAEFVHAWTVTGPCELSTHRGGIERPHGTRSTVRQNEG